MNGHTIRATLLLAAAMLVAASLAGSAGARPEALANMHLQIEDPAGDSGSAPDLTLLNVGNDVVAGPIVIWIDTANRDRLGGDDMVSVFLDADQNPATGLAPFGIDYVVGGGSAATARVFRWDGAALVREPAPSLRFEQFAREIRISIQPADLGGTRAFDFFVAATNGVDTDFAPDGGPAVYTLRSGPVVLSVEAFRVTPRVARAGRRVTAVLLPGREDTFEVLWEGTVRCTAKVGKTSLPTRKGWSDAGAFCSLAVPKTAKGKRVTVTLSVAFGGRTVSRTWRSTVR
ncbi:MAG: hypothetical protein ICV67_05060 [Thermoleophilia bacterium]|nr:hypothetical protein [Thermoleophilia bacterium]